MFLTKTWLKKAASPRIYARGREYFLDGRVLDVQIDENTIYGHVQGTEEQPYVTQLIWKNGSLRSRCTCPFEGFCKHAVALGLAALEQMGGRALVRKADAAASKQSSIGGNIAVAADNVRAPRHSAVSRYPDSDGATRGKEAFPTWEDLLEGVLREPPAVELRIGETHLVFNLAIRDHTLEVSLEQARFGKRGLGKASPFYLDYYSDHALDRFPSYYQEIGRFLRGYGSGFKIRLKGAAIDSTLALLSRAPFVFMLESREPVVVMPPLEGRLLLEEADGGLLLTLQLTTVEETQWTRFQLLRGQQLWLIEGGKFYPVHSSASPLLLETIIEAQKHRRPASASPSTAVERFVQSAGTRVSISATGPSHLPAAETLVPAPGSASTPLAADENPAAEVSTDEPGVSEGNTLASELARTGKVSKRRPGLFIPRADLNRFINQYLPRLQKQAILSLPPSLVERIIRDREPRPILTLKEEDQTLVLRLDFAYGDGPAWMQVGGNGPELLEVVEGEKIYWVQRQLELEREARQRLVDLGLREDADGYCRLSGEAALDFLYEQLPKLPKNWEIYGEENLRQFKVLRAQPKSRATLSSGIDWLDLEVTLDYGEDQLTTGELLPTILSGRRYVRLRTGQNVRLPEEWLERLRSLLAEKAPEVVDARLRLRRYDVALATAWLETAEAQEVDDDWRKFLAGLKHFGGINPTPLPAGLKAQLRPYQKQGYDWLTFLRNYNLNGILADDMGLGKTVQTLALLLAEKEAGAAQLSSTNAGIARLPSLVVVPTSLVFNWVDEIRRFAPGLKVLPLTGSRRRFGFPSIPDFDLVITTYSLVARDGPALRMYQYNYLILDEAQKVKNHWTQGARAVRSIPARHRLILTGTPLENNLAELWAHFDFLMPGFLGRYQDFLERYARPILQGDAGALERLKKRIYPFILRRLKEDVASELPPKTETVLSCELSPGQRKLYQQVLATYRAAVMATVQEKGLARSRITILDALLKLRQICLHPQLLQIPGNRVESSSKLELFRELVTQIVGDGHRVLVFSQFVQVLNLLRRELNSLGLAYEYLDGQTRDREARVKRFQEDERIPVFLLSLKAGGTGLNLTGASYVIHFDPWWNPAVESQATDRAYRIGQEKKVFTYHLITKGTIEEKILKLQETKRALVGDLLPVEQALGKQLTHEDLEMLFSFDTEDL